MPNTRVIINFYGGAVQDVFCSDHDAHEQVGDGGVLHGTS